MAEPVVAILGGGPAGLGAAWRLRRERKAGVVLLEQNTRWGGNAGSIEVHGQRVDFGSHRLHPACDERVLADIRALLGDDLLDRPRHGRIRLRGRWIHFPLKPADLLLHLDPGFAVGTLRDLVRRPPYTANGAAAESFASVLWSSLGPTICRDFYFPYARKIWGREPDELSAIQAKRRVSAGSFRKLARKIASQLPGLKRPGAGRFFYPRRGFGQISEAYAAAAVAAGAELRAGVRVTRLELRAREVRPWIITTESAEGKATAEADHVWSTIPVSILPRIMTPVAPEDVMAAATSIEYRAMLLVYLTVPAARFTEYDAHYFPDPGIAITRLSEPKNYAALEEPRGLTTLCAELPCAAGDAHWSMGDDALGRLVAEDLARAGIPLPASPTAVTVQRLRFAYPIYRTGYEAPFGLLDAWAERVPRLLSYGRQGLFAHDNTHHALFMAYAACDCLIDGEFDEARWSSYREVFATHVVED